MSEGSVEQSNEVEQYKVFVGNVPYVLTDEAFVDRFSNLDDFCSANVIRGRNNRTRGFGFVVFNSQDGADKLLNQTDFSLNGQSLRFASYQQNNKNGRNWLVDKFRAFVSGLPLDMTPDTFQKCCENFGEVASVHLYKNRDTNLFNGSGFVRFKSKEDCQNFVDQNEVVFNDDNEQTLVTTKSFRTRRNNRNRFYKNGYRDGYRDGLRSRNKNRRNQRQNAQQPY